MSCTARLCYGVQQKHAFTTYVCVHGCDIYMTWQGQSLEIKQPDFVPLQLPENILRLGHARSRGCWRTTGFLVTCSSMTWMWHPPPPPHMRNAGVQWHEHIQGCVYSGWHGHTPILALQHMAHVPGSQTKLAVNWKPGNVNNTVRRCLVFRIIWTRSLSTCRPILDPFPMPHPAHGICHHEYSDCLTYM